MNKWLIKSIIVILPLVIIAGVILFRHQKSSLSSNLLKVCPEAWYENDMPPLNQNSKPEDRQYFIIKGQNKPLRGYDVNWIKKNCDVKIQVVS